MKYFLPFFLAILLSTTSFAQSKRDESRANIIMLKSGALFVRLKTSDLKVSSLKARGYVKEAEEVKQKQEEENKALILAFKNNFTFCSVYFFYSNYSNEVKAGNYKGLIFDVNMKTDSTFSGPNYLIGEYDESATTGLDAFFIKDKNYAQLKSPFPFLIKQNQAVVTSRSNDAIVALLNKRLFEYFGK